MCQTTRNLRLILTIVVLIGGINWGLVGLFDFNLVTQLASLTGPNYSDIVSKTIYIVVGLATILLAVRRNTYLPFLGEAVIPKPITDSTPDGSTTTKKISGLPSKVKVLYWAAKQSKDVIGNPKDAYDNYTNQGVTTTDKDGNATLSVRKPASYDVNKMHLAPHIHYRYWTTNGMASPVYTVML
jgi:uncharacterized membrane protein YuzA (DUF378 family)